MTESISYKGDCRTAQATPGLLNSAILLFFVILGLQLSIRSFVSQAFKNARGGHTYTQTHRFMESTSQEASGCKIDTSLHIGF